MLCPEEEFKPAAKLDLPDDRHKRGVEARKERTLTEDFRTPMVVRVSDPGGVGRTGAYNDLDEMQDRASNTGQG
ncbi:hypothetical protein ACIHAA_18855 [Streptomyces sp. NPDC052040]|uniref:hypothetical protein n=1 Tax=Streptomyces sp. NPDC052040 TaxID=3365682 RepID=UPI0037D8A8A8